MEGEQEEVIKIIIVGDAYTGKTSILHRFVSNSFEEKSVPTIGAAFADKTVTMGGKKYKINIWDTAGQETYRGLIPMYYRGAGISIITFDLTNEKSFLSIDYWNKSLREHIDNKFITVLCGNKIDLTDSRVIEDDQIQDKSNEIQAPFFLTSAQSGVGIQKMFDYSVNEYLTKIGVQALVDIPIENPIEAEKVDNECC